MFVCRLEYAIEYDLLELKTKKTDYFHIISRRINNDHHNIVLSIIFFFSFY